MGPQDKAKKKRRGISSPPPCSIRPEALLALWLAFLVGRRQWSRPDVDVALLRGRSVCNVGRPPITRQRDGRTNHTGGRVVCGAKVGGVLYRVSKKRLFGRHEVPQIRLHRCEIRLLLRVSELRNRDRGQNADDHHDDQKLDQCKALAVHLVSPEKMSWMRTSSNGSRRRLLFRQYLRHELCLLCSWRS